MKDIVNVKLPGFDKSYEIEWFDDSDFSKLKNVKQVYGLYFNDSGKLLIVNVGKNWQLPGGTPEEGETFIQTLLRETDEEADADVKNIIPLGFQKVTQLLPEEKTESFFQIRYFGMIDKLRKSTIDPATGKMPKRKFISPKDFSKYCPWGQIGPHVVELAVKEFDKLKKN